MIKKSVFENDLIAGMHANLIAETTNTEVSDLSKATDYLNSASEILEALRDCPK